MTNAPDHKDGKPTSIYRLDMASSVLTQVHFLGNRIQATGSASYRKWYGLGISEFRLLVVIGNEPGATGACINEIMGLDLGAISRTLRRMEEKALVYDKGHQRHSSYRSWFLTDEGMRLHDEIREMTELREATILDGFSKAEVFQLLSFLHRLSENAPKLSEITQLGLSHRPYSAGD